MRCPECGEEMIRKINFWECPNCSCVFVKNNEDDSFTNKNTNDISNKINELRDSESLGKVISGIGTVAEQVSVQAKKEEAYIKTRKNGESTALVDENEFFVSKYVLDGVDFVSTKKQEIGDAKKARNDRIKQENEEKRIKKGEEKVKKEAVNRPENALFYIDGREGTLAIFDEFIQLDFTVSTVKKYLSKMGGIKRIYYPQINSIQKRDAGSAILGSIEFELPGMVYSGWDRGKSENIIHYEYYYQEEADKIYEFVNQKILNIQKNKINPQPNIPNETSVLSEIKKAKELLDMGAITQEEFDDIKKELL